MTLSFVLGAIACAFAGFCYAEMASTVPVAGSAYTYAYATMGEIIAWIIGWDLLLEYALGAATVAIGWSGYVVSFLKDFGITIPDIWTAAPFDFDPARGEWQRTAALINAPAMLVTAIASMLLVVGIHESAKVNNVIVVIKVGIVVIFIFASIWFLNTGNWVTATNPDGALIPPNLKGESPQGICSQFSTNCGRDEFSPNGATAIMERILPPALRSSATARRRWLDPGHNRVPLR